MEGEAAISSSFVVPGSSNLFHSRLNDRSAVFVRRRRAIASITDCPLRTFPYRDGEIESPSVASKGSDERGNDDHPITCS